MHHKAWAVFWIAMGILSLMAIFMGAWWHLGSLAICIVMAAVMMPKNWIKNKKKQWK